jgi:hypothetical protein
MSKRSTAYHEAGHAVVRRRLGLGVKSVTIVEDDEAAGRAHYYAPGAQYVEQLEIGMEVAIDGRTRRRIESEIMCGWAGRLAEERLGEAEEIELAIGARGDLDVIHSLAWRLHEGNDYEAEPFIEWLRRRTERLLAGELVAEALLAEGTLSGRRFCEVRERAVNDWLEARSAESPIFRRSSKGGPDA